MQVVDVSDSAAVNAMVEAAGLIHRLANPSDKRQRVFSIGAAGHAALREDMRQQIVAQIPAGRLAMPDEVADAVAILASDKAGYITGTNLAVNGGLHMYA